MVGHRGLAAYRETGSVLGATYDRGSEADIHRLRGEVLVSAAGGRTCTRDAADAERCFRTAVDVARRRGARSAELRGALALARLWQARGEPERARRLLAPRCRWFTEGAETSDLQAARKLLGRLP